MNYLNQPTPAKVILKIKATVFLSEHNIHRIINKTKEKFYIQQKMIKLMKQ